MRFRDLQFQRRARALHQQRTRRTLGLVFSVGSALALTLFAAITVWRGTFRNDAQSARPANELTLSFGLSREPITRNFMLELQDTRATGLHPAEETISVRLLSDPRRSGDAAEFPAEQLTVGMTRISPTRVNITVTANPWTPERVAPGLYLGTLELRGGDVTEKVPISVWLRSRENKWAALAALLLTVGASLGLVVKWITERLTPQAALVRRLTTLKQTIGFQEDSATLPVGVRLQIKRLEDEIEREDYASAEASFKKLEAHAGQLAILGSQFGLLLDQLAEQAQLIQDRLFSLSSRAPPIEPEQEPPAEVDPYLLDSVLDSEYREMQDLLATPSEEPQQEVKLLSKVDALRHDFGHVHSIIAEYIDNPAAEASRAALLAVQSGSPSDGLAAYKKAVGEPSGGLASRGVLAHRPAPKPTAMPFGFMNVPNEQARMKFQFRYARTLAGIGSVLIVSLAGLKLQYLDEQNFDGTVSEWIGLLLWAAVVELSGVSVLDVLGRLGTSGTRVRATSP